MGKKITEYTNTRNTFDDGDLFDVSAFLNPGYESQKTTYAIFKANLVSAGFLSSGDNVSELTNDAGYVTSNITHTGEVTGLATLSLNSTAITNKTTVTAASGDFVLISDTSDAGNLKKVDAADFLAGGADTNFANTDLTFTTNRTHDLAGNNVTFDDGDFINNFDATNTAFGGGFFSNQIATNDATYGSSALPILMLNRAGQSGVVSAARAMFSLKRFEVSGTSPRTQLDLRLAHSAGIDTDVMSLRSNGNVGIGTTSPTATLDVNGTAYFDSDLTLNGSTINVVPSNLTFSGSNILVDNNVRVSGGGDSYFSNGNLLIGTTTNPSNRRFLVDGDLSLNEFEIFTGILNYFESTNPNFGGAFFSNEIKTNDATYGGTALPSLMLNRAGDSGVVFAARAVFNLKRFEVSGQNARTQLDIRMANAVSGIDTDVMSLRSNGNVGIGETAPTSKLHVGGDLRTDGNYIVNGNTGFTGTGAYTNFTIEGGIITAAS